MDRYLIPVEILRQFALTLDKDDELYLFTQREIARREAEEEQQRRAGLN
jgi:hypothetical protein